VERKQTEQVTPHVSLGPIGLAAVGMTPMQSRPPTSMIRRWPGRNSRNPKSLERLLGVFESGCVEQRGAGLERLSLHGREPEWSGHSCRSAPTAQ
jgi:hypothetical protein